MPPPENQQNLHFGRQFHKLLLEPEKFNKYHVASPRQYLLMLDMVKAVKDVVDPIIFTGKKEHEFYYSHMNFRCKLKADIVVPVLVGDFKTTGAWNDDEFLRHCVDYDYLRQGAWYLDCPLIKNKGIDTFKIWAVGKAKPHPVFQYELHRDDEFIRQGRIEYQELLSMFAESVDADLYRQYESDKDVIITADTQIPLFRELIDVINNEK